MSYIYLGRRVNVKGSGNKMFFNDEEAMGIAFKYNIQEPVWADVTDLGDIHQLVVWEKGTRFDRRDVFDVRKERLTNNWAVIDDHFFNFVNRPKAQPMEIQFVKLWGTPIEGDEINLDDYLAFGEKRSGVSENMDDGFVITVRKREDLDKTFAKMKEQKEIKESIEFSLKYG